MSEQRTHTRRVSADEDVWSRLESEAEDETYGADSLELLKKEPLRKKRRKKRPAAAKKAVSDAGIRERHQRSQKQQRLFAARMRALAAMAAALVIFAAVIFLTPLFNVRSISVSGNTMVSAAQVSELVGNVKGTNLFLASGSDMAKKLKTIKYINDVDIEKTVFPPSIAITVTEYIPAGYVQAGSAYMILDSDMYIIEEAGANADLSSIPCIIGMKVSKSDAGSALIPEDKDVGEAAAQFMSIMRQCGETANIVSVDFSNMNNITFNYANRITVSCGTQIDFDRKLRLFCETVKSDEIGPDARGTMDLSDTVRAIYTP